MKLSQADVKKLLTYDLETGQFRWKMERRPGWSIDQEAGSIRRSACGHKIQEYRYIEIHGRSYSAHRLAWLFVTGVWPSEQVDHADGNSLNNSWRNLREATRSQNKANTACYLNNKIGIKGVSKRGKKFVARIRVSGELIYLGRHDSPEAAQSAYAEAAIQFFGSFARAA